MPVAVFGHDVIANFETKRSFVSQPVVHATAVIESVRVAVAKEQRVTARHKR